MYVKAMEISRKMSYSHYSQREYVDIDILKLELVFNKPYENEESREYFEFRIKLGSFWGFWECIREFIEEDLDRELYALYDEYDNLFCQRGYCHFYWKLNCYVSPDCTPEDLERVANEKPDLTVSMEDMLSVFETIWKFLKQTGLDLFPLRDIHKGMY